MAKKLRPKGTGSDDQTVTPTGSGRLIQQVEGGEVVIYAPSRVEGSDTVYTVVGREPLAKGAAPFSVRHGD